LSLVVLDIGVGNTASMVWALERLGARPVLSNDPAQVEQAERLVFPGVGAARYAAAQLDRLGLRSVLTAFDRPMLGVCLGMQLLFDASDEGEAQGVSRLPGRVRAIPASPERPSPHMGWNTLTPVADEPLLDGVPAGAYAYFVHGFAAPVGPTTTAVCDYGAPFSAMVRKGALAGCQFHPERSGVVGARVLKNFLAQPC